MAQLFISTVNNQNNEEVIKNLFSDYSERVTKINNEKVVDGMILQMISNLADKGVVESNKLCYLSLYKFVKDDASISETILELITYLTSEYKSGEEVPDLIMKEAKICVEYLRNIIAEKNKKFEEDTRVLKMLYDMTENKGISEKNQDSLNSIKSQLQNALSNIENIVNGVDKDLLNV